MEFGDILRELLENNELNQKMLADELHISPAAIGNYVRGNQAPDYQTLKKSLIFFMFPQTTCWIIRPKAVSTIATGSCCRSFIL